MAEEGSFLHVHTVRPSARRRSSESCQALAEDESKAIIIIIIIIYFILFYIITLTLSPVRRKKTSDSVYAKIPHD